jgi:hypothetical protein
MSLIVQRRPSTDKNVLRPPRIYKKGFWCETKRLSVLRSRPVGMTRDA